MKTCHYYLIIEPLIQEYKENKDNPPSITGRIITKTKEYEIAFFGNEHQLYMFRISIPDLTDEIIPEEELKIIQHLKEHLITSLRFSYNPSAQLFPRPIWTFVPSDKEFSFGISMKEIYGTAEKRNLQNIRDTYLNSLNYSVQVKLISDAQNEYIPLQYRYLSLYKFLEFEFKEKRRWLNTFDDFLNKYGDEFYNLFNMEIKLKNYVHKLRDRCAHIKSARDVMGVTQLSNEDMIKIEKFLPFLTNMCIQYMNDKKLGFTFVNFEEFTKRQRAREIASSAP